MYECSYVHMEKTSHKYEKQTNNEDNLKGDLDKSMQMETGQVLSVVYFKICGCGTA
jgi:hypothetical protein